jgi:hypothetical protein
VLGLPVAVLDQLAVGYDRSAQTSLLVLATPFFTLSYIGACRLAAGQRVSRRATLNALGVGVLVFLPVGLLVWLFVLPALAWLAVLGLSVPVALFENRGIRESMRQARRLAAVGYVHALGSLATLVVVYVVGRSALVLLLAGQSGAGARTALFLADLVLSPLLFLGSALLYFDQKARLESAHSPERRPDARLHHALDADRPGRPDPEVEPGPAARGEP